MNAISSTLQAAIDAGTPQRVLLEFIKSPAGTAYNPVVTMSNEVLREGFELTEYFNSETDLTVGLCPSAEFKFDLFNDESFQYENFEFGTFRAWLGARIDQGVPPTGAKIKTYTGGEQPGLYEFTRLGVFIAEKPNIIRKQIVTVTAYDQMVLFDQNMPSGLVNYPITLKNLASAICESVGVTMKTATSAFLNKDMEIASEPEEFENATMREVLGWIAEAAGCIARFTRDGKLEFVWFNTVNRIYDEHSYSDFSPAWYETKPIDKLVIRNSDGDSESIIGTGSNSYYIQNNPFLKQGGGGTEYSTLPTILTWPINRKGKKGTIVTFSVIAENAVEYQWKRSSDGGSTWTNIASSSSFSNPQTPTLSAVANSTTAGYVYKCAVRNSYGEVQTTDGTGHPAVTLTLLD